MDGHKFSADVPLQGFIIMEIKVIEVAVINTTLNNLLLDFALIMGYFEI